MFLELNERLIHWGPRIHCTFDNYAAIINQRLDEGRWKIRGSARSLGIILWGPQTQSSLCFMLRWTHRQTDQTTDIKTSTDSNQYLKKNMSVQEGGENASKFLFLITGCSIPNQMMFRWHVSIKYRVNTSGKVTEFRLFKRCKQNNLYHILNRTHFNDLSFPEISWVYLVKSATTETALEVTMAIMSPFDEVHSLISRCNSVLDTGATADFRHGRDHWPWNWHQDEACITVHMCVFKENKSCSSPIEITLLCRKTRCNDVFHFQDNPL